MAFTDLRGYKFVRDLEQELASGQLVLPTFPEVALRVRRVLHAPDVDVPQVVRVVQSDPALTARLLKLANSAMLSRGGSHVDDVKQAINRLGFSMVRNAAMSVAVEQVLATRGMSRLGSHLKELWQHSVEVAAMAYALASITRAVAPDEALLAGLLHDIGHYYVLLRADAYPDLLHEPEALARLREELHGYMGKRILEAWHFPQEMTQAAEEHGQLTRIHDGPADLTDVVMVANLHANLRLKKTSPVPWDQIPAFQALALTPEKSIEAMKQSRTEIEAMASALRG